jgi:hypothetical protein
MKDNYRAWFVICGIMLALSPGVPGQARADLVRDISTGLNSSGTALLPGFTVDPNYTVTGPGGGPFFGQARLYGVGSLPLSYLDDAALPNSRWLYLVTNPTDTSPAFVPAGNYTFRTTIDLTGFDPSTASIRNLQVASDNMFISVAVNGSVLLSRPVPPVGVVVEEFGSVLSLPATLGLGAFHSGLNTIELTIFNQGFGGQLDPSPGAFRVRGTIEATPTGVGVVPESSSVVLLGPSLVGLALLGRARQRGTTCWGNKGDI